MFPTLRHVLDFLKDVPGKSDWLDSGDGGQPIPSSNGQRAREEWDFSSVAAAGLQLEPSAAVSLAAASAVTTFASTSVAAVAVAPDGSQRPQATIRPKANAAADRGDRAVPGRFCRRSNRLSARRSSGSMPIWKPTWESTASRKRRCFRELGEFYEVSNPENLRLDDFVTLRNVLELLQSSGLDQAPPPQVAASPAAVAIAPPVADAAPQIIPPAAVTVAPAPSATSTPSINGAPSAAPAPATEPADAEAKVEEIVDRLHGLAYDAARQFGEKHRPTIRARLKRLAENASKEAIAAAGVSRLLPNPEQFFAESELEELRGLSEGAGVFLGNLLAHHWAIDPRRRGEACATAPVATAAPLATKKPGSSLPGWCCAMIDAPPANSTNVRTFVPVGAAVILGDNALAQAVATRLASLGAVVEVVSSAATWPQVREQFEQAWSRQPIRHLFLATAHDPDARLTASEADWQRRFDRGVLTPFFLCQDWLTRLEDARLCDGATLVALTALGGDFGFSGDVETVEGGAATGLVKSLFIESRYEKWTGLRFKTLDFPAFRAGRASRRGGLPRTCAARTRISKSATAPAAAGWCGRWSSLRRAATAATCLRAPGW